MRISVLATMKVSNVKGPGWDRKPTASRRPRLVEVVALMGLISKVPEKFSEHPGGVWAETEAARARIATAYFMVFWRCFKGE